jgi:hypothetical protein
MRTAVIRINVDPRGELSDSFVQERINGLASAAAESGMELVGGAASRHRDIQLLMAGDDVAAMRAAAAGLCARIFGTEPATGVVTFVSRGTDDDALGVLAGLGLTGEITRSAGADGWDVVSVRLPRAALERVPESRVHTALEASLNCEVQIIPV